MKTKDKTVEQQKSSSSAAHNTSEKSLQRKAVGVVQKAEPEEEVQQHQSDGTVQKMEAPELEEDSATGVMQHKTETESDANNLSVQRKENKTGMPDNLKSGIENLSGMSMDHVKVHYNSAQPAQLNALAYAQGSDIHIGPGQEKHLPHEAWHVVQQAQGRVQATTQMKGQAVNDDVSLESEADSMGAKAMQLKSVQNNVIQMQQTEVYAKQIVGTYIDKSDVSHAFNHNDDLYLTTTSSHPKGKVDYTDTIVKALKKNGTIPKDAKSVTVTSYEQFGRKL